MKSYTAFSIRLSEMQNLPEFCISVKQSASLHTFVLFAFVRHELLWTLCIVFTNVICTSPWLCVISWTTSNSDNTRKCITPTFVSCVLYVCVDYGHRTKRDRTSRTCIITISLVVTAPVTDLTLTRMIRYAVLIFHHMLLCEVLVCL